MTSLVPYLSCAQRDVEVGGDRIRLRSARVVGEVERRQIMSERDERVRIDCAQLREAERLEDRALDRLVRPLGKVVGPHGQEDRLRGARRWIVEVEAEPSDLL